MPPVAVGNTTYGNTFYLRTALSLLHAFTYSFAHSAYPQRIQNLGVSSMWSTPPPRQGSGLGYKVSGALKLCKSMALGYKPMGKGLIIEQIVLRKLMLGRIK